MLNLSKYNQLNYFYQNTSRINHNHKLSALPVPLNSQLKVFFDMEKSKKVIIAPTEIT